MKTKLTILGLLAMVTLATAQFSTNSYTLSPGSGIPDGNPSGLMEQFAVTGLSGPVSDIQLSLNIVGGFNGDLYAYLAGPQGQLAILLNRVGVTGSNPFGYSNPGMNIIFDGLAVNNIHDYGNSSLNGTVWAADGRNVDPLALGGVLYGTPTTDNLGLFQNTDPNGIWTLFIADMGAGGGMGILNSTMLTVVTVPEPQTWALLGGGLVMLWLWRTKQTAFSPTRK